MDYQQEQKRGFIRKARDFGKECIRVLKVTKKPDNAEFKTIVKMSALGMFILGFIGFVIQLTKQIIIN